MIALLNTCVGAVLLLSCRLPATVLRYQGCGCSVVLHLQLPPTVLPAQEAGFAITTAVPLFLELQIAVYGGTANLVRTRTGGEVPDLQIAINGRARAYGEGACADLHIAGHLTLG